MTDDEHLELIVIRMMEGPLGSGTLSQMVRVFREARRERLSFLLDLHDAQEDRRFLGDVLARENEIWVAECDDQVVGFIAFANGWVNQLYISPGFQGRGIGTRLLSVAQQAATALQLWAFEINEPAVRFYLNRGFRVVERTNGAGNEAKQPDVRMEWRATQPIAQPFPRPRQAFGGAAIQSYDSINDKGGGVRLNRLAEPGQ